MMKTTHSSVYDFLKFRRSSGDVTQVMRNSHGMPGALRAKRLANVGSNEGVI